MFDLLSTRESCIYAEIFISGCVDEFAAKETIEALRHIIRTFANKKSARAWHVFYLEDKKWIVKKQ